MQYRYTYTFYISWKKPSINIEDIPRKSIQTTRRMTQNKKKIRNATLFLLG